MMRVFVRKRRGMAVAVLVLVVLPFLPYFAREDVLRWLVAGALLAGLAVAFDFTAGYINVVNFGFAAFVGAGSYTSALTVIHFGVSPWIAIFGGAVVSGILGLFTGLLTLRLRGIYASVVAWFFGLALLGLARNLTDLTRGSLGLVSPRFFDAGSNRPYYFVAVGMLLITFLTLAIVVESRLGLALAAIGQNYDAARASGVNPTRYRLLSFALSCLFAGWLGGFYAHYFGILTPQIMDTSQTIAVLVVAYLGGRGTLWGPAAIAFPFVILTETLKARLSDLPGFNLVIYGAALILVMIFYPRGFAGAVGSARAWFRRRVVSVG